ncbi:hypothetical protein N657DRAFT_493429 [Parathielavia appendiculata]|uniref:Uncharacterized protein n=1 Tax=Parathielavia appendiculata TaxID=2587402 RepID=A0AAN6TWU5_9PEZI|nr:hypothetical protein N657DRAFT_493429 [Parathielavia appendiculata]
MDHLRTSDSVKHDAPLARASSSSVFVVLQRRRWRRFGCSSIIHRGTTAQVSSRDDVAPTEILLGPWQPAAALILLQMAVVVPEFMENGPGLVVQLDHFVVLVVWVSAVQREALHDLKGQDALPPQPERSHRLPGLLKQLLMDDLVDQKSLAARPLLVHHADDDVCELIDADLEGVARLALQLIQRSFVWRILSPRPTTRRKPTAKRGGNIPALAICSVPFRVPAAPVIWRQVLAGARRWGKRGKARSPYLPLGPASPLPAALTQRRGDSLWRRSEVAAERRRS